MNQVDGFQIVTDCNVGIPQLNNSMLSVPSYMYASLVNLGYQISIYKEFL